ncbi:MAG: hypothetical protein WCH05_03680 [Chlorobiaceae bacterium]
MPKERSESILEEIEKRHAVPIPRWHFLLRYAGFWLLAALSVLTGSIAMAAAIYVFIDNDFIADQDNINRFFSQQPAIADMFESIPYIWLGALLLFTLSAYIGLRHTSKGYRYPATRLLAGSVAVSLVISLGLNTMDVGGYIHRYLIENVHIYNNLIYANEHRWTHSETGRLGGKITEDNRISGFIVIRDFKKGLWLIDISKAELRPGTSLDVGKYLKITGVKIGKRYFRAVTIQAWEKKYHRHPPVPIKPVPALARPDSLSR